jgi:hypothetical protein
MENPEKIRERILNGKAGKVFKEAENMGFSLNMRNCNYDSTKMKITKVPISLRQSCGKYTIAVSKAISIALQNWNALTENTGILIATSPRTKGKSTYFESLRNALETLGVNDIFTIAQRLENDDNVSAFLMKREL